MRHRTRCSLAGRATDKMNLSLSSCKESNWSQYADSHNNLVESSLVASYISFVVCVAFLILNALIYCKSWDISSRLRALYSFSTLEHDVSLSVQFGSAALDHPGWIPGSRAYCMCMCVCCCMYAPLRPLSSLNRLCSGLAPPNTSKCTQRWTTHSASRKLF